MEKVDSQSQPEPTIQHFSHQHPLQLINHQPQQSLSFGGSVATCWCCRRQLSSGWVYSCMFCQYFLHVGCSQMPRKITHLFENHVLSLLPEPIYPGGLFICNACRNPGNGFSYHCGTCSTDLHTTCAAMPLLVSHPSHHHQLNLVFSLPCHYINGTFGCNICHKSGSMQWLYRCNLCGFDAHLGCATHATHHQQQPNAFGGFGVGVGRPTGQRPPNGRMYMNQLLGHLVSGTAGGIAQGLLQGFLGGGSGSDGGTSDGTGGDGGTSDGTGGGYWG